MILNARQKRFVDEYLIDLNATQAALRSGYSAKTAYSQGQRLLKHVEIQKLIAARSQDREKRTEITQDRVLQELARMAFGDTRKIFDGTRLLMPEEWDDDTAATIAAIEFSTKNLGEGEIEHVAKVKSWDKTRALEMIGRHLGMFNDKLNVDVNLSLANRLEAARRRAFRKHGDTDDDQ